MSRLALRPVTHEDAHDPTIVGWHTDPEGYALMHEEPESPDRVSTMVEGWADAWDNDGYGYWIAEQDGVPVGIGGVRRLCHEGRDYLNLYYRLDPAARGRGLGREIARAGTSYAAQWLPHLTVLARIAPANTPSLATVARAGMVDVGPFRGPHDPADQPAPICWQGTVVRRGAPDAAGRQELLGLCPRDDAGAELDSALADPDRILVRLWAPTPDTWDDPDRVGELLGFGFAHRDPGSGPHLEVVADGLRGRGFDDVLRGALAAATRSD